MVLLSWMDKTSEPNAGVRSLCAHVAVAAAPGSLDNQGSNDVLPYRTMDKFVHSTLLQFTQLYERVSGSKQWWIFVIIFEH